MVNKWVLNYQDHVLCGTCLLEFERRAGYFGNDTLRAAVTITPVHIDPNELELIYVRYCCRCGQQTPVDATFVQDGRGGCWKCDGDHEVVVAGAI